MYLSRIALDGSEQSYALVPNTTFHPCPRQAPSNDLGVAVYLLEEARKAWEYVGTNELVYGVQGRCLPGMARLPDSEGYLWWSLSWAFDGPLVGLWWATWDHQDPQ